MSSLDDRCERWKSHSNIKELKIEGDPRGNENSGLGAYGFSSVIRFDVVSSPNGEFTGNGYPCSSLRR